MCLTLFSFLFQNSIKYNFAFHIPIVCSNPSYLSASQEYVHEAVGIPTPSESTAPSCYTSRWNNYLPNWKACEKKLSGPAQPQSLIWTTLPSTCLYCLFTCGEWLGGQIKPLGTKLCVFNSASVRVGKLNLTDIYQEANFDE